MKTLKTSSTFGNFDWSAETEVSDGVADVLAAYGLLQILQRSPSSAAEKTMAGYEKRPQGFKRTHIPFSAENADVLRAALETATVDLGNDKSEEIGIVVNVSEHVATAADVKMSDERAAYERNASKLDKLATRVGYAGPVGDGTKANAPVEFLRAIRRWTNEQLKALDV